MVGHHHKRGRTKKYYYRAGPAWPVLASLALAENVIHQFQLNINIDVLKADRRQETLRGILTNPGGLFSNPVDILLSI